MEQVIDPPELNPVAKLVPPAQLDVLAGNAPVGMSPDAMTRKDGTPEDPFGDA